MEPNPHDPVPCLLPNTLTSTQTKPSSQVHVWRIAAELTNTHTSSPRGCQGRLETRKVLLEPHLLLVRHCRGAHGYSHTWGGTLIGASSESWLTKFPYCPCLEKKTVQCRSHKPHLLSCSVPPSCICDQSPTLALAGQPWYLAEHLCLGQWPLSCP